MVAESNNNHIFLKKESVILPMTAFKSEEEPQIWIFFIKEGEGVGPEGETDGERGKDAIKNNSQ